MSRSTHADVIVIGSGVGGGSVAYQLAGGDALVVQDPLDLKVLLVAIRTRILNGSSVLCVFSLHCC